MDCYLNWYEVVITFFHWFWLADYFTRTESPAWNSFHHPSVLRECLFSVVGYVSWRQQKDLLLNVQSISLCLLIEKLRLLTFNYYLKACIDSHHANFVNFDVFFF